ncbi:diiron oxygenase [Streptomyces sp. MNP-20]|uniref:AurF N-oxygenase family protein n=1 Tax=Streptomyces sp. MNP-20 TaxID=2721165 RepID=UPI001551656B|nr:diiron oxygenase [Streptomyces sp. MNP-20]
MPAQRHTTSHRNRHVLERDRETTAQRLLVASARHSSDPDTELDWTAPFEDGKWYVAPELISLYKTPLWERMSEEQRMELSRHERASITCSGIWFEQILMHLLLRHLDGFPCTSDHVRYAYTEIADECRHSMMFGRLVRKLETPVYGAGPRDRAQGWFLKTLATSPAALAAALLVEELLDWLERKTAEDERVQPLVRNVIRIHIIEEARHVRYAREELRRQMRQATAAERAYVQFLTGQMARVVARTLISPSVYNAVGLDPATAVKEARRCPHRQDVLHSAMKRLVTFFEEVGVIHNPAARSLWYSSGLMPRPGARVNVG